MDDKLERILTHPLLRDLPDSVMAEIRQLLVRRSVRAGAHIHIGPMSTRLAHGG